MLRMHKLLNKVYITNNHTLSEPEVTEFSDIQILRALLGLARICNNRQ